MADIGFKYTAGMGAIPPPTNANPSALYLTDGRLYKGNVLIADKSPDNYTWDKITAKPTTLAGYGIVDGATKGELTSLSTKVSSAETNIGNLSSYVAQNTTAIDNIVNGTTAVGNANKLATPRSIWGHSFDGTGDVNGDLTVPTINGGTPITSSNIASQSVASLIQERVTDLNDVKKGTFFRSSLNASNLPNDANGYLTGIALATDNNSAYRVMLGIDFSGYIFSRAEYGGNWLDWKTIAFTDSNVAQATYATYIGDSNEYLSYQSLNDAIDQITDLENAVDALPETYSPLEGSASLTKYSGGNFGNAAAKNYTTSVQSGNANLVTSGAVFSYLSSYAYKSDIPSIGIFMATSIQNGVLRCEYVSYFGENGSWGGNDDIYDGDIIVIINPNNVNGNFTSWMDTDHDFEAECGTQCSIYSGSGITLAALSYKLYPTNYL